MVGIYGLLLLLSLLLLLVVATSCRTQLLTAYAQIDFSILDIDNGIHSQVIADTIFDIFTRAFEHSVEIDADQIFSNETLKREIINKPGSYDLLCLLWSTTYWVLTSPLQILK